MAKTIMPEAGRLIMAGDGLQVFEGEGCRMVEMSCEDHDRIAASTQFMTHTVGRILGSMDLAPTAIDTRGFQSLLSLVDNTTHDSFDLYYGLFMYNAVRSRTSRVTAVSCIRPVHQPSINAQVDLNPYHGLFPHNEVHWSYQVIRAPLVRVSKHCTIRTLRPPPCENSAFSRWKRLENKQRSLHVTSSDWEL